MPLLPFELWCVCVCMYVYIYVCMHVCMYIYVYAYVHICICMYVFVCVCVCVCVCVSAHTHTPVVLHERLIEHFWVEDASDVSVSMRRQRRRLRRTLQSVHFVVDCLRGSALVFASLLVRRVLRG